MEDTSLGCKKKAEAVACNCQRKASTLLDVRGPEKRVAAFPDGISVRERLHRMHTMGEAERRMMVRTTEVDAGCAGTEGAKAADAEMEDAAIGGVETENVRSVTGVE